MKKNRLESFSDGVFAIVITLLVLSINIPKVDYRDLNSDLISLIPSVGVYVLSFILVGMYWVFHHHASAFLHEVDGVLVWLNVFFLLFISFLPFPTTLMGRYPFQALPVFIYGVNLLLANLMGFLMIIYLRRNPQLCSPAFTRKVYRSQLWNYAGVNGLYLISLSIIPFSPRISFLAFSIIAVYLIFRSIASMGIGKCILETRSETSGNFNM